MGLMDLPIPLTHRFRGGLITFAPAALSRRSGAITMSRSAGCTAS